MTPLPPAPHFSTWTADAAFGLNASSEPSPPSRSSAPRPLIAELASVALEAAQAAAAILLGSEVTRVETKISATDMVSDVDRASEAAVTELIRRRRPDDAILGEEGANRDGSSGITWVVDPLDGTTNYLFGIPQFSVSIGAELDGHAAAGIVVDPSRNEVWAATAGGGAWCNGVRSHVAEGRSTLDTALVVTGFGYRAERRRWQAEVAARVIPQVRDIRRLGSAALDLSWLGGGRSDAYYEWGLNPWDLSAGALIASEAGAVVAVRGERTVVAAPPSLFDPFCTLLQAAGAFDSPPGPEPKAGW